MPPKKASSGLGATL
jgi:hypothetical protein